ncbi:MAG: DUF1848 domain-containing protein [Clostridia bacterium]|nr:DUF1848 domain-containing protein [Clostridia bacterium]
MIISTGMRTDIPAFYSEWLLNRFKEGYVLVRNPYNHHQVTKYLLDPKVVDCVTFCTKNPLPILDKLSCFDRFRQYWFVTITPYGKNLEPRVPDWKKVTEGFVALSRRLGPDAVCWRYDPVLYGEGYDFERHEEGFFEIASALRGYTNACVVSFLDRYEKVKKNAPNIYPPDFAEQKRLIKRLVGIAKTNGMTIRTCCEGRHLSEYGADVSGCQTKEVLERAIGERLDAPVGKSLRAACDCLLGNDIGAYDSCPHLCKYCYANTDPKVVADNVRRHDKHSPFLIGGEEEGDVVTVAKQKSWVSLQDSFF